METCSRCTHAACAGQYSTGGQPLCWDCKKVERFTSGWVVLYVECSAATGGVYLSGRNLDSSDRLFRAFRWDMSTALNDPRYNFELTRFADARARTVFERLGGKVP